MRDLDIPFPAVAHWVLSVTPDYREAVAKAVRDYMDQKERDRLGKELAKDMVWHNGLWVHKYAIDYLFELELSKAKYAQGCQNKERSALSAD